MKTHWAQTLVVRRPKGLRAGSNFKKAYKHKILLSTGKSCLAEGGYQPTFYTVYIVTTGTPFISCLAKTFEQLYEIGPWSL